MGLGGEPPATLHWLLVPVHGAARSEHALYRSLALRFFLARRSSRCRCARTQVEPVQRSLMLKEKRPGTYLVRVRVGVGVGVRVGVQGWGWGWGAG